MFSITVTTQCSARLELAQFIVNVSNTPSTLIYNRWKLLCCLWRNGWLPTLSNAIFIEWTHARSRCTLHTRSLFHHHCLVFRSINTIFWSVREMHTMNSGDSVEFAGYLEHQSYYWQPNMMAFKEMSFIYFRKGSRVPLRYNKSDSFEGLAKP